ncbi:DDE-type integrase/transposase/recombinase, partial [Cerasicoccus arenae]|uniref:DDE-type integrase/transposase/recombinase n=1 Tax=Cerasicoccus arenae TaxID=424488 RepID=UPI0035E9B509
DLAAVRVRYGYRRLTVLLKREAGQVGPKRVYRIYKAEGLDLKRKKSKKRGSRVRAPLAQADASGQRWSMDFITDKLNDGRRFRVLTVVDQYDRTCPVLYADRSISVSKVADALDHAARSAGALPQAITVDNGPVPRSEATTKRSAHLLAKCLMLGPMPMRSSLILSD